jgi:hypothetical protein
LNALVELDPHVEGAQALHDIIVTVTIAYMPMNDARAAWGHPQQTGRRHRPTTEGFA